MYSKINSEFSSLDFKAFLTTDFAYVNEMIMLIIINSNIREEKEDYDLRHSRKEAGDRPDFIPKKQNMVYINGEKKAY